MTTQSNNRIIQQLHPSLSVCGLATLAAAATYDWVLVAPLRALADMGVAGILLTCAVLIFEWWPANSRAVAHGILGVAFPVGIVMSGGLNVMLSNWREAFWVGFLPLALVPIILCAFVGLDTVGIQKDEKDIAEKSPLNTLFHA